MKHFLIFLLAVLMEAGAVFSQTVVYSSGKVSVVQDALGWRILQGEDVVAHGDGILDMTNLPPAFMSFVNFYAQTESVKVKKSQYACADDAPVYGPLLRTAWDQIAPYNNECPMVDGERALAGCTSISSTQLMNFYGYCPPLALNGTGASTEGVVSSPYFSDITATGTGSTYSYSFSFVPDFAKINSDIDFLAKFIFGVALAQKADFGPNGTGTNLGEQIRRLSDTFGYEVTAKNISSLNDEMMIDAIEKCRPVILSGRTAANGGHSFIIDGYNGSEFHVDYGWGGRGNGWFTVTNYPYSNNMVVAYPDDEHATYMRPSPQHLHITGNGVDLLIEMVQYDDNVLKFKQKDALTLPAGEYAFCFEYADGSTLAPYSDTTIVLRKEFEKVGRFVTDPASFSLSDSYNLDFFLFANDGSVKIVCTDYEMTISGQVLDCDENPLAGAMVTTADAMPEITVTSSIDADSWNGRYMPSAGNYYDIASFVAEQNYLAKFEVKGWVVGSPGLIDIVVMSDTRKILWQTVADASQLENNGWTVFQLDEILPLEAGKTYTISFMNETFENGNYYVYYVDDDGHALYRVWTCDDYFVRTDADGAYSLMKEKRWSGTLHAYYDDKDFNTWTFTNLDDNLSDADFVENGDDETYEGETTTAVAEVASSDVRVWTQGRCVIVENALSEIVVFDAQGAMVCKAAPKGAHTAIAVPAAGLYIVRTGNFAEKVMVLR